MPQELKIFLTAIMFYTRLPVPRIESYSEEYLNESLRYLPVVGWIVGLLTAVIFRLCLEIFPLPVAILLSMVAGIFFTGAFHEDAFTDTCDGLGGGWTKQEILKIMKDSRVGAFGTIGIILILGLKFLCLWEIPYPQIPLILFLGHTVSRTVILIFRYGRPYVGEEETSKSKLIARTMTEKSLFIGLGLGLAPVFFFLGWKGFWFLAPVILTQMAFGHYIFKRIGGFTGDCLGAIQQVCEVVFYLSSTVLWKYI